MSWESILQEIKSPRKFITITMSTPGTPIVTTGDQDDEETLEMLMGLFERLFQEGYSEKDFENVIVAGKTLFLDRGE